MGMPPSSQPMRACSTARSRKRLSSGLIMVACFPLGNLVHHIGPVTRVADKGQTVRSIVVFDGRSVPCESG